jgi:hypothetical protein
MPSIDFQKITITRQLNGLGSAQLRMTADFDWPRIELGIKCLIKCQPMEQ